MPSKDGTLSPEEKNQVTEIIPFVPVMCSHCGNTAFLNAAFVGILVHAEP